MDEGRRVPPMQKRHACPDSNLNGALRREVVDAVVCMSNSMMFCEIAQWVWNIYMPCP
jgi:hypothetical protein